MNLNLNLQEGNDLAHYATKDAEGRLYHEPDQIYRTPFQRDRDRIIHSRAFRRLGYKTQVFVNSEGDNYRTRLTHSLEVSQIARSVATTLKLNRDLAETLALAHDLGHTPFGHAGQEQLHALMQGEGGFEHNRQALRIVSVLEDRYPLWEGLNLTRATLKGMMKHGEVYSCDRHLFDLCRERQQGFLSLEMTLVDRCDRIAYVHHDLEDGLDSGYLKFEALKEHPYWNEAMRACNEEYGEVFRTLRRPLQIRTIIRHLLNQCITDLIETSAGRLQKLSSNTTQDEMDAGSTEGLPTPENLIGNSTAMAESIRSIYEYLHENLYRHPDVIRMSRRGERMIELLFREFMARPTMLPRHVQKRIDRDGLHRVVSDYISGMTDRYAEKQFLYLTGG